MGLFDNLKGIFSGQKNVQPMQMENPRDKAELLEKIEESLRRIKSINSMDPRICFVSNASEATLRRKSLNELKEIRDKLDDILSDLKGQGQRSNSGMKVAEAAKWTGRPAPGMSMTDLDRFQRGDDGR